jgi:hypothetical protein
VTCSFRCADRGSGRAFRTGRVPGHVMIQKSWRSSIIRDKPGRTIIKRVEADVVLQRVNQVPELALEAACFTGGAEVAFEHVELHSRTVTRQERRHVLAAVIIGYVVREYVSHRDRQSAGRRTVIIFTVPDGRGAQDLAGLPPVPSLATRAPRGRRRGGLAVRA